MMQLELADNGRYRLEFGEDEELPYAIWTELVKWRADYRCQQCGRKQNREERSCLVSHHIVSTRLGGKTSLRNGKCLCFTCHSYVDNYGVVASLAGLTGSGVAGLAKRVDLLVAASKEL